MAPRRQLLTAAAMLSLLTALSLPVASAADAAPPAVAAADQAAVADPEAEAPSPPDPGETEPTTEADPTTEPEPTEAEPTSTEPPVPTEPRTPTTTEEPATPEEPAAEPTKEIDAATAEADVEAAAVVAAARAPRRPEPKVTICHRTNSRTNPYNQIVVSEEAAIEGHASHIGPIFSPDVENWGDIIPPIRPGLRDGLNWPEGRDVLDNGCEVPPDVGPLPEAAISDVTCDAASGSVTVTVRNREAATAPANFAILVNGTVVETVVGVAPGTSETVVLSGDQPMVEDQTFTIAVRSGGEVIATRVVTVDCDPDQPSVEIDARLACAGTTAQGTATVTNNGQDSVVVTVEVDGVPVGSPVTVDPGQTTSGSVDLSPYEDQTVSVSLLVDGVEAAAYTVTPDCVAPQSIPRVAVDGVVCPPPSSTVTLANDGDPDSKIVFSIRINGKVVQVSAPIYGGDSTTIVGDLSRYEDQRVTVELRANGEVLGSRTIEVDCVAAAGEQRTAADSGAPAGAGTGAAVPTVVAAGLPPAAGPDADRASPLVLGMLLLLVAGRAHSRAARR